MALDKKLEVKVEKGKLNFVYNEKGEDNFYALFPYLRGKAKWAKVLQADQYGNFAVDVYATEEDKQELQSLITELAEATKEAVEGVGKKVAGIAEPIKEDDEGVEYFQFKRKEEKGKPKIYNKHGNLDESWDKLVGNGSTVKVGIMLSPYYMATTKMVGVSLKFYAIQVIDLVEYSGGSGNSGFGDETDGEAPFNEDEEF